MNPISNLMIVFASRSDCYFLIGERTEKKKKENGYRMIYETSLKNDQRYELDMKAPLVFHLIESLQMKVVRETLCFNFRKSRHKSVIQFNMIQCIFLRSESEMTLKTKEK